MPFSARVLQWRDLVAQIAPEYGVDPNLELAIIQQESGGDPNALSATGARGLTQLEPGTAAGLGVTNSFDPAQNIRGGVQYIADQLRAFDGDVSKALAAYNAGPGAVQKYGGVPPYAETQNYVAQVRGLLTSVGDPNADQGTIGPGAGSPSVAGPQGGTTPGSGASAPAPSGTGFDPLGIGAALSGLAANIVVVLLAVVLVGGGLLWLALQNPTVRTVAATAAKAA